LIIKNSLYRIALFKKEPIGINSGFLDQEVVGTFFECFSETDEVILSEDHDEYLWIDPREYKNVGLIENLYPVFEAYLKYLSIRN